MANLYITHDFNAKIGFNLKSNLSFKLRPLFTKKCII